MESHLLPDLQVCRRAQRDWPQLLSGRVDAQHYEVTVAVSTYQHLQSQQGCHAVQDL
jgi:hypothetical protein